MTSPTGWSLLNTELIIGEDGQVGGAAKLPGLAQFPVSAPAQFAHQRPALPHSLAELLPHKYIEWAEKVTFPLWFDNSMLNDFTLCELKGWYSHFKKIQPKVNNEHLHFGSSFAKALETARLSFFAKGRSVAESESDGLQALWLEWGPGVDSPPDSVKTLDRLEAAYISYLDNFPLDRDPIRPVVRNDRAAIEFGFAIPLPHSVHPETGEPILYVGRFDMLAEFEGAQWVYDDKTASALGTRWQYKWKLSPQMSGYTWAAREYGKNVAGALVRGTGILKTQIKHQTVPTQRTVQETDRWLWRTEYFIQRAIQAWQRNYFVPVLNDACTLYGNCPYKMLCESNDPAGLMQAYYAERNWDPLKRHQTDESYASLEGPVEEY